MIASNAIAHSTFTGNLLIRMLRDRLLARLAQMGATPDHQRLAEEVLGIRGAPPELARKLVAQALVVEDRRDEWRRAGERICRTAPAAPGVYVFKDAGGTPIYVGKAVNLRRRLRTHFADRRWRAIKPEMSRVADAEWIEVGSDLEALLREAALIAELQPVVNVQIGPPDLDARAIPRALVRDVLVILPSIEEDSVELVAARADGPTMIQRTRRNGADLAVHSRRLRTFFAPAHESRPTTHNRRPTTNDGRRTTDDRPTTNDGRRTTDDRRLTTNLAPLVFSWLSARGAIATRLDPHDSRSARDLAGKLAALLRDDRLFHERLEQC